MNSRTNEIYDLNKMSSMEKEGLFKDPDVVKVPKELHHAADKVLKGKKQAKVSKTSGGKLSKFSDRIRKQFAQQRLAEKEKS